MSNVIIDKLQQAAKGIAGGVAGAIVSVLFTTVTEPDAVINPDSVPGADQLVQLPNTEAEWWSFFGAIILGFVLPYLKRNFPSVLQAEKQLDIAVARKADGKQTE